MTGQINTRARPPDPQHDCWLDKRSIFVLLNGAYFPVLAILESVVWQEEDEIL